MRLSQIIPTAAPDSAPWHRRIGARSATFWLWTALVWIALVLCAAVVSASGHVRQIAALVQSNTDLRASLAVGLLLLVLPVLLTTLGGALRVVWPRALALMVAVSIIPVLLYTSGQIIPAAAALLVLTPPCVVGRIAVERCIRCSPLDAWVLGGIFGLGLVGIMTAALGALGIVGWRASWLVALVLAIIAFLLGKDGLRRDLAGFGAWLRAPTPLPWLQRVQVGLIAGVGWLMLFSALVPEIYPDAVAFRLPAAAYVAESGHLGKNPDLLIPLRPGLSELIYAAVFTVGGLDATKFASLTAGWLSMVGVAAIARHLGGDRAMVPAALSLACLPLMLRTLESASADVFAVLFAVGAGLLFVRPGTLRWRTALLALSCVLLGLTVKASFAVVTAGFVVAAPLAMIRTDKMRTPAKVGLLLGLAGAVILVAAVALNLDAVALALAPLNLGGSGWISVGDQVASRRDALGDRLSLLELLRSPFELTFRMTRYAEMPDGAAGYLFLALVPLAVLARPCHQLTRLLVVSLAACAVWFWSGQYVRFGLPIAALLCALCGLAASRFHAAGPGRVAHLLEGFVSVLAVLGLTGYLLFTLISPGLPWRVVFGLESRAAFLSRVISEYEALSLLNAEPGRKLAAVNMDGPPQIYSRAALNPLLQPVTWYWTVSPLQDAQALLHIFDHLGYTHIVLNQGRADRWWVNNVGGEPAFLRENTSLVGGVRGVYVYRILPPEQRGQQVTWTRGPELLPNSEFAVNEDGVLRNWTSTGAPWHAVSSGQEGHSGEGAVVGRPGSDLVTTVAVTPNQEYFISLSARAEQERGWSRVLVVWQDEAGRTISLSGEILAAGYGSDREWWMLATAPATAARAIVQLQAVDGPIWFDRISMRERGGP